MNKVVTFDGAPPPGTINLGLGQPSAELLPIDLVQSASNAFLASADPLSLNYGPIAGDPGFLDSLAGFLSNSYNTPVAAAELFETSGSSQALDLVSTMFARPGDTVFVEEPCYFLAFQVFRDHHLNFVGIPIDEDGLNVTALREALGKHKPAFLYTIPSFHNPGGQSTSAARRREIVELAAEYDFLIVADEVYQLLNYYAEPPPAYGTMTASERVLSLGSFSKILAPGMRLGWIQSSSSLLQRILANGFVNSGGCLNRISAHIVQQAMDDGTLAAHIDVLKRTYRRQLEAMHDALLEHFSDLATWTKPVGGFFFWLTFARDVDTSQLRDLARDRETGFQGGAVFSSQDGLHNSMRLCFAHYDEDDIREGIRRLRTLF